jgi:hypothetical protein
MLTLRRLSLIRCIAITCALCAALIVVQKWKHLGVSQASVSQTGAASSTASTKISNQSSPSRIPLEQIPVPPALRSHVAENYGKLPLSFEANRGQSDKQVKFLSRGQGYTLFLTNDEAVLSLRRSNLNLSDSHSFGMSPSAFRQDAEKGQSAVLRMKLVGANKAAPIAGTGVQEGKSNYFIGNDPSQWRTNVSNYSQVRYQDAYPGVDLVYYGNQKQLEYDFVVAPGADPNAITLDVAADGATEGRNSGAPRIDANGDLLVLTHGGEVRFHKPVVYQTNESFDSHAIGGEPNALEAKNIEAKNIIDGRWVLKGGNRVGFEVAAYDPSKPLVIDPALSYSTYLGGTGTDGAFGVAIDSAGNCYVTGFTSSTNFPTKNPYQKKSGGGIDTFVTKLNATGTALVYSTYVGGSATEYPFAIGVDSTGAAYELGNTGSANFPVTAGAFQTTCISCALYPAVFLTKLSPSGTSLAYSTFLGGSGDNRAFGIALDSANDAYIVGWTTSVDFPTTPDAFQTAYAGGSSDVFVTELNPAASTVAAQLVYSTYLGGSGQDVGFGIALDSNNNTYVTGYTYSTDFPVTAAAFQTSTTVNGAAWVTKLNVGGTALLYSTYLGGTTGTSAGNSIKTDANGAAYITGYTCASDFPVTQGVFQSKFGGDCTSAGGDGFVTKLNPTGSAPVFSSYLGGTGDDVGFSIGLDSVNNIYITGRSSSPNYPVTKGAFQTKTAGGYDTIYTIVNPTGTSLLYSTYLGGAAVDVAFVMAVDSAGNAYIIGRTYSTNFPVTPGSFQATLRGATNAVVYKFSPGDQVWPMALNFGNQTIGVTSSPLTTTLTNSGPGTLAITGAALSGTAAGDYTISSNTCTSSLAFGASCVIGVTLTPSASGTRSATLAITDGALNSPQNVPLTGVASSSSVSISPATMTFTTQTVGTTSTSQAATLTNAGTSAVTITSIAATAPFSQTNNCPTSLTAGASCTINVSFTPTKGGPLTGALTVTDNATNSPQTVALTGTGTVMNFSPTSLNFGTLSKGTASPPQTITVTNLGTTSIAISKISITGSRVTSFSETNNCPISPATLGANASCTISVVFTPQLIGALNADVTLLDTGGGSPQNVPLSGTGD